MTEKSIGYPLNKPRRQKKKFVCIKGSRFEVTPDGLLYRSEDGRSKKKHKCPDCYFCQWCSDSRCSLCRSQGKHPPQKSDRS